MLGRFYTDELLSIDSSRAFFPGDSLQPDRERQECFISPTASNPSNASRSRFICFALHCSRHSSRRMPLCCWTRVDSPELPLAFYLHVRFVHAIPLLDVAHLFARICIFICYQLLLFPFTIPNFSLPLFSSVVKDKSPDYIILKKISLSIIPFNLIVSNLDLLHLIY